MTLDDLKAYFGTSYRFNQETGMAHTNYLNWQRKGYIPILAQKRIEEKTGGKLTANYDHAEGLRYAKRG